MSLTPRTDALEAQAQATEDQSNNHEANGIWKVGDIKQSFLTPAQFIAEHDDTWVLCDGQSVVGSDYETITGDTNIPDARGVFLRGINNGVGTGTGNPSGEVAPGTYQTDEYKSHTHTVQAGTYQDFNAGDISRGATIGFTTTQDTLASGGAETRPRNISCNIYIKINREPSS
jgi:hypothetical protein